MCRALVVLALLLPATARATEFWQDQVNTAGNVPVVTPPGGSCFLYETAPFDVQCYTTIPSGFISGVPTGVLEGLAGAITAFSATPNFVPYGAAANGGLQQSTNLQFTGFALGIGAHATSPQPQFSSIDSSATITTLQDYPGSGTNVANILRVSPRGTGTASTTAAVQVFNTDATNGNQEILTIVGRGPSGFSIISSQNGTGALRPIAIGTDQITTPKQLVCATNGDVDIGAGNVVLNQAASQAITKVSGVMSVGTDDANAVNIKTNGTTRVGISSTGLITVPAFAGGGNQCCYFDNTGLLSVTGSACGTGTGAGGITQLTGDVTAGPGSGSQAATVVNLPNDVSQAGDLLATSIAAPATPGAGKGRVYVDSTSKNLAVKNDAGTINHGAQTAASSAGVALTGLANDGSWTTQSFQAPLVACTDYVSLSCVTGATDLGGTNATPTVIGVENDATMRGDLLATAVAAPATPAAGKARVYVDSTSKNVALKNDAGTVNHGVQTVACAANNWMSASTDAGGLTCTQPAFSSLSGSEACSQTPAFIGDVTKASGSCTTVVANLPDGTTAAGKLNFTPIAAPATPAASHAYVYVDSTSKNLAVKNDAATVSHALQTYSCPASQWAQATNDAGATTCVRPTFADLSGSATCANLPALTGDVTTSAGTCATSVVAMQNDALARGDILYTAVAAPASPGAGSRCYADSTTGAVSCKNSSGTITHGTITYTCGANTWATSESGSGTVSCTQPAFSNLTGSAACAQLPALTGDVTSAAGSCAMTSHAPTKMEYFAAGLQPAITSGYLATSLASMPGGTLTIEYPMGVAATSWTISVNVLVDTLTGGPVQTTQFYVSRNGLLVGSVTVVNGALGVFTAGPGVVAGSTSDTWGVYTSGNGAPGGTIAAAITVTLTP